MTNTKRPTVELDLDTTQTLFTTLGFLLIEARENRAEMSRLHGPFAGDDQWFGDVETLLAHLTPICQTLKDAEKGQDSNVPL